MPVSVCIICDPIMHADTGDFCVKTFCVLCQEFEAGCTARLTLRMLHGTSLTHSHEKKVMNLT